MFYLRSIRHSNAIQSSVWKEHLVNCVYFKKFDIQNDKTVTAA